MMSTDPTHRAIDRMIDDIAQEAAAARNYTGVARISARVLDAMREVPRDQFVPADLRRESFDNRPLCIGHGQTISQPFIVALMTELLQLQAAHRVLEIGTGCGYQTAVLARLAHAVFTVEIIPDLAERARRHLTSCALHNIQFRRGDGYEGWPEQAPFDRIIVTAAAPHVPPPLLAQLASGGRMIIPVGLPHQAQTLRLIEKDLGGAITQHDVLPVAFVPLTGGPAARQVD